MRGGGGAPGGGAAPRKRAQQRADVLGQSRGAQQVYRREEHDERRENIPHDAQPLCCTRRQRGENILAAANPRDAGCADDECGDKPRERIQSHSFSMTAAAAIPAASDTAELTHTAGIISKAAAAP